MKVINVLTLAVCTAILVLQLIDRKTEEVNMVSEKVNIVAPSTATINEVKSRMITFEKSKELIDSFRTNIGKLQLVNHTGGTTFKFEKLYGYLQDISVIASNAGLGEAEVNELPIYIATGLYPPNTRNADDIDVSNRLTSILMVSKKTNIFDPITSVLNLQKSDFLTAYNWGSLEP